MCMLDNYGVLDPSYFTDPASFSDTEFEDRWKNCKTPEEKDKLIEERIAKSIAPALVAIACVLAVILCIGVSIAFYKWISGWIF